jgi:cob(I)alamin adenosyltransferase
VFQRLGAEIINDDKSKKDSNSKELELSQTKEAEKMLFKVEEHNVWLKMELDESKKKINEQNKSILDLQNQIREQNNELERSQKFNEICSPENLLNQSSDLILSNEKMLSQTRIQHKEISRLENEIDHWKRK